MSHPLHPGLVLNPAAERSLNEGAIDWCHVAPSASVPPVSGSYNFLIWELTRRQAPRHLVVGDHDPQTAKRARESEVPIALLRRTESAAARARRFLMARWHRADDQASFEWAQRPLLQAAAHLMKAVAARRILVWGDLRWVPPMRRARPEALLAFAQRHYDFPHRSVHYNRCDVVLFQTPGQVHRASDRLFSLDPLVVVIPNGVDVDRFAPADAETRAKARRKLGLPAEAFVLLFPSALTQAKGVGYLLRWIDHFQARRPEVHFLLPNRIHDYCGKRLQALLRDTLPRATNVTWLEGLPHSEMPTVFQASDLTLLPQTRREGFAHSCLESMSCGVVPVVVGEGGPGEYVVDGVTGVHLPLEDVLRSGIEVIEAMRSDPERRRRMGSGARRFVETTLPLEKQMQNFRCFFDGAYEQIDSGLGVEP